MASLLEAYGGILTFGKKSKPSNNLIALKSVIYNGNTYYLDMETRTIYGKNSKGYYRASLDEIYMLKEINPILLKIDVLIH